MRRWMSQLMRKLQCTGSFDVADEGVGFDAFGGFSVDDSSPLRPPAMPVFSKSCFAIAVSFPDFITILRHHVVHIENQQVTYCNLGGLGGASEKMSNFAPCIYARNATAQAPLAW